MHFINISYFIGDIPYAAPYCSPCVLVEKNSTLFSKALRFVYVYADVGDVNQKDVSEG